MPSRWFVPVPGVDPHRVRLEYVHAAFSRWFDQTTDEHAANEKPYALSPVTRDEQGHPGVEIATLTEQATKQLHAATAGASIRLGNQIRPVGTPRLMFTESWAELAQNVDDVRWHLEFLTPTTFRSGDRSSPLPRVETVLDGLARAWRLWSGITMEIPQSSAAAVWVSDLNLSNLPVEVRMRGHNGRPRTVVLSGCLGTLTLRSQAPEMAAMVGPLLRSAAYIGVGGMTAKGLGVTRVRTESRPRPRASELSIDLAAESVPELVVVG